jgi:hypothetical protein
VNAKFDPDFQIGFLFPNANNGKLLEHLSHHLILLKISLSYKKLSLLFYGSDHMLVFRVEKKVLIPLVEDLCMDIAKLTLFFFTSWQLHCILTFNTTWQK